jgi:hypothetical protein
MSYCGPEYTGRGCQCYTQPTLGITPVVGLATSGPICGYIADSFLYGCDAGCCPGGCPVSSSSPGETTTTGDLSSGMSTIDIILLVFGILYCILLVIGVVWASRKKQY